MSINRDCRMQIRRFFTFQILLFLVFPPGVTSQSLSTSIVNRIVEILSQNIHLYRFDAIFRGETVSRLNYSFIVNHVQVSLVSRAETAYEIAQKPDLLLGTTTAPFREPSPLLVALAPRKELIPKELLNISEFYKIYPNYASMVYFFLVWPHKFSSSPAEAEGLLKSHLSNAPLDSHFYLVMRSLEIWEYYTIMGATVFQRVLRSSEVTMTPRVLRRNDFRGVSLTGLAIQGDLRPLLIDIKNTSDSKLVVDGVAIKMFAVFGQSLNFTMDYMRGSGWIGMNDEGRVAGMGQQLLKKEGDIAVAPSELLAYRLYELSVSQPFMALPLQAYFKKPHPSLYRNVLVEAFPLELYEGLHSPEDEQVAEYGNAFFLTVAAMCQQGWHCAPSSLSLRVVVLAALVASLLYYTAYAASIVSIFSVEINRLRNIDDLFQHGFTLYGNTYSLTGLEYVKVQTRKDGVPFQSRLIEFPEALEKIENSHSALLFTGPALENILNMTNKTKEDMCPWLSETPLPNTYNLIGFYFRKYNPIKKYIDMELTRWDERGLLFHEKVKYRSSEANCGKQKRETKELVFWDLRCAYAILVVGYTIGTVELLLEILLYKPRSILSYVNQSPSE